MLYLPIPKRVFGPCWEGGNSTATGGGWTLSVTVGVGQLTNLTLEVPNVTVWSRTTGQDSTGRVVSITGKCAKKELNYCTCKRTYYWLFTFCVVDCHDRYWLSSWYISHSPIMYRKQFIKRNCMTWGKSWTLQTNALKFFNKSEKQLKPAERLNTATLSHAEKKGHLQLMNWMMRWINYLQHRPSMQQLYWQKRHSWFHKDLLEVNQEYFETQERLELGKF